MPSCGEDFLVFPTHVGMNRASAMSGDAPSRIPHARGDEPRMGKVSYLGRMYSSLRCEKRSTEYLPEFRGKAFSGRVAVYQTATLLSVTLEVG